MAFNAQDSTMFQFDDSSLEDEDGDQVRCTFPESTRRRSTRACDQCRKAKSKCVTAPGNAQKCRGCVDANISCTFNDPTYKRGPPKGYIFAIEQRWQQVESILGAILASSDGRAQGLVADLRQDDSARTILDRVSAGPYGRVGRLQRPEIATKEDVFASISKGHGSARDPAISDSPSRRQSRLSRELVSAGHSPSPTSSSAPTREWQDKLRTLLQQASAPSPSSSPSLISTAYSSISTTHPSLSPTVSPIGVPFLQRRRLDETSSPPSSQSDWSNSYPQDHPNQTAIERIYSENLQGQGSINAHDLFLQHAPVQFPTSERAEDAFNHYAARSHHGGGANPVVHSAPTTAGSYLAAGTLHDTNSPAVADMPVFNVRGTSSTDHGQSSDFGLEAQRGPSQPTSLVKSDDPFANVGVQTWLFPDVYDGRSPELAHADPASTGR